MRMLSQTRLAYLMNTHIPPTQLLFVFCALFVLFGDCGVTALSCGVTESQCEFKVPFIGSYGSR